MTTMIFHVEGMSCNHCVQAVESNVAPLNGVDTVSVDLDKGLVTVEGNAQPSTIEETIEAQGFDVTKSEKTE